MAKKTTKPVELNEVEVGIEAPVITDKAPVERTIKQPTRKYSNKLTVTLADGSERVYTPFTHGKVWEALANNFAKANEGSVIE